MKKSTIILLSVLAFIATLTIWFVGTGNSLIQKEEAIKGSWAQVENVYQRRADLIPNLVNTVKGYASHEKETLEGVIQARNQAVQLNSTVNTNPADPEKLKNFQKAQDSLGNALGRLMVLVEKYPDLKANENFKELQNSLEGTENRIAVERRRFNEVVQDFNSSIRMFPASIVASFKNMQSKPYFEAQQGASTAPKVQF